jgi:hypothetical protein
VVKGEVEMGEEEGPSGLSARKVLLSLEIFEIFVISLDLERFVGSLEEVTPVFKGVYVVKSTGIP